MAETILFVFEGAVEEKKAFDSISRVLLNDGEKNIYATFNTGIYQLYDEIKEDDFGEYLDIVQVLKDKKHNNFPSDLSVSSVSEVYLFFDYDGHAYKADDSKLKELIAHFDNETENGKLFVSYPMLEAVKHLNSCRDFNSVKVTTKNFKGYKQLVRCDGEVCYQCYPEIDFEGWKEIIRQHCVKANYIVNNDAGFPDVEVSQKEIFDVQLSKYIIPNNEVAVLSGFPLYVASYYGVQKLKKMIVDGKDIDD